MKDIKPKPLEQIPYTKPIPSELKEVEQTEQKDVKLTFGDFRRIVWSLIINEAIKIVNPIEAQKVVKTLKYLSYLAIAFIILLIGLIIGLLK